MIQPFAVFSRDTLLQPRWFLSDKPKGTEGIWSDILKMNDGKQHIFIQRVLFVFEVDKRSAGKAQSLRMSKGDWAAECEAACLAGFVVEEMQKFRDPENAVVFEPTTITAAVVRFIEGLFDQSMNLLLEFLFNPSINMSFMNPCVL